eukprot:366052-Chlamydomonas_euryale.AAC.3
MKGLGWGERQRAQCGAGRRKQHLGRQGRGGRHRCQGWLPCRSLAAAAGVGRSQAAGGRSEEGALGAAAGVAHRRRSGRTFEDWQAQE